jgi:hypothetical protein
MLCIPVSDAAKEPRQRPDPPICAEVSSMTVDELVIQIGLI